MNRITTAVSLAVLLLAAPGTARERSAVPLQVDAGDVPSGILYDRVLPLSNAAELDGRGAPVISRARWLQAYHEMIRASLKPPSLPAAAALRARAVPAGPGDAIPVMILHARYDRLAPGALEREEALVENGRLSLTSPSALTAAELFAAAPAIPRTYRGGSVSFTLDPSWVFRMNAGAPARLALDPGDGGGFRRIEAGGTITAAYPSTGSKILRVRATLPDGRALESASRFTVVSLQAPLPDDTLAVTGSIPYNGGVASGEAYVYLAPGHTDITQPAVVLEGFDIDNNMNWDELYALLNDENLIEDVRALGYDILVLNFADAKDYIQRNAMLTLELLQQLQSIVGPTTTFAVLGASMGGLCARYALCYMESNSIPHRARTYVSFDTPHRGANIPLGIQYWLDFFASESADAAALLASLDSPAARQMLVYHHGSGAASDPLRAAFVADLAALGDYPASTRNVAMANGSATMQDQGFSAGSQIIRWEYDSFLVDVRGNVWAVPDPGPGQILEALIDPLFISPDAMDVTVSNTRPYDSAPGGWRGSMAQMDAVAAPYGDIVALHDNHCFVPTVSALDLDTTDLFYDVAGDPDILALTAFDAVYFPAANQPHVDITPENKQWIVDELLGTPTAARPGAAPQAQLLPNIPNPFNPSTTIRFTLPAAAAVRLSVYDVRGARVAVLADGAFPAGAGETVWNGLDDGGNPVGSGVYFVRLEAAGAVNTRKIVLVK